MATALLSRVHVLVIGGVLAGLVMGPQVVWAQAPSTSSVVVHSTQDSATATVSIAGPGAKAGGFHPSRVIVRFRGNATFLQGSGNARALSATDRVYLVDNPPGLSVASAVGRYRGNPNVIYAEPDYTVSVIPNDPELTDPLNKQWDMSKISAPAAWDIHTNSGTVVVAVVDTGIDYTHPDLIPNLYSDAVTPSTHGYTCMGGTCVPGGLDDYGHGTHVAGTIGAATNNAIGVAGINWSVQLLSIKFLGSGGSGSISDAVLGFGLLRTLKMSGINIRVTNNSWGGGGYSDALRDAMAALEDTPGYPSTLDVCAAGNSNLNADVAPMYPGAYDLRGIVSVVASDSADVGASFTNFGLASTDIAAPGVTIYSTAATSACPLCDATGYRTLSGTSMASPHVAGVAAAMLSMYPALTAAQARDALLHPDSYDTISDAKARSTSSGGRLNFYKTITNTGFLGAPVLNTFPTVTVGPDVSTTGGGPVNFTATVGDLDGHALRTSTGRGASVGSTWLFGWELNQVFPAAVPFTAPSLARTGAMPYDTSVADNYGGGAFGRNWAFVFPVASPGGPPTGTLTVPATGTVGVAVPISFPATDPEGLPVAWDIWASGSGGSSGSCCFTGTSVNMTFGGAGAYRVWAQAIDRELLTSLNYSAVISIGGATGVPPIAAATLDKLSGPVPLVVNVDMSASLDPDGSISYYYIGCGGSYTVGTTLPTGSCTFTEPGTYWMLLQVRDNAGYMGLISRYVVATLAAAPPPPTDTTAPTATITNPAAGNVTGSINLQASASDNAGGSGVKEVEYYMDSTGAGASLGKATTAPSYTVGWNTSGVAVGSHTIYAIARDNQGNPSAPASVGISVNVVNPTVTMKTPANGAKLARKANVAMTSTVVKGTYNISRVDYLVGGVVACSGTVAATFYPCTWKTPAAAKTYTIQAKVYDVNLNVGTSAAIAVSVK